MSGETRNLVQLFIITTENGVNLQKDRERLIKYQQYNENYAILQRNVHPPTENH